MHHTKKGCRSASLKGKINMKIKHSKHSNFIFILAVIVLISLGLAIIMKNVYGSNSWQSNIFMIIVLGCTFIRIVDIIMNLIRKAWIKFKS